jgi:hypothetical protein
MKNLCAREDGQTESKTALAARVPGSAFSCMFVPAWSPSRDSLHLVVEAYPDSISTVDHQPVVSSSLASELEVFSTSSETPASSDPRRFKALDWAGRLPLHIAVSAAGDDRARPSNESRIDTIGQPWSV